MNLEDVTYRHVAKMLASALPVEDAEFGDKVEEYLEAIKALPQEAKNALKTAYIFSRKVPREEREDLFQDIALAVFRAKTSDEKLAYAIARCDWQDFWKKYTIRQHTSLDSVVSDSEGSTATLADLLVGECEFENKQNGKFEAERIWSLIPDNIKPIVLKKLEGKTLTAPRLKAGRPKIEAPLIGKHRKAYSRWLRKEAYTLLPDKLIRFDDDTETSILNRWLQKEGYKLVLS